MENKEMSLREYALENFPKKNDYSFIEQKDLEEMIDALIKFEQQYIDSIEPDNDGEYEYDDEAAFGFIVNLLNERSQKYAMYHNAIVDDFMDVSEQYMNETGNNDWV
ncbi:MAG: hypothetical protein GX802_00445 [Clostridiales bacterium]|nr:hypothetical protein [Clostridiales bacterium]